MPPHSIYVCVFYAIFLLTLLHTGAFALPFHPKTGVRELASSRDLAQALKTHKPVLLLLYAPWCGHCKAIHPEYEKVAKKTRGVAEILAIDCDKHKDIAQMYNVKGFPTLVQYGKLKNKKDWKAYEGARTAGSMATTILSLVETAHVSISKDIGTIKKHLVKKGNVRYALTLFTEKNIVPPLLQIVSYHPELQKNVATILIRKKQTALIEKFNPSTFPSIAIVEHDEDMETPLRIKAWHKGPIGYEDILSFVSEAIGISLTTSDSKGKAKENAQKKKSTDTSSTTVAKPALPVRLISFNEQEMNSFCKAGAPLKKGQQPFCVIVLHKEDKTEETKEKAQELFQLFVHEPFIVMHSTDLALLIRTQLIDSQEMPALIVFRYGVKGLRSFHQSYDTIDALLQGGKNILERLSNGDLSMLNKNIQVR